MEPVSSASSPDVTRRDLAIVAAAVLLGAGIYLVSSALAYRVGFPLDDSWIHETYARNLALQGQWAFQLGQPSAGSTAPLWTIMLVPGFWLGLPPPWWSHLLGAATLFGLAVAAEKVARGLVAAYRPGIPWVALFIASEWHMLWAALSGMETLLQALVVTIVLALLLSGSRRYLGLGLLTGLSVWIRPDGLTLVGPVLIVLLAVERGKRFRGLVSYLIGLGALVLPYVLLNLWLSGTPLPNTFYAKQAEYAAWQARPVFDRLGAASLQLVTGPSILLVPGLVMWLVQYVRRRDVRPLAVLTWCGLYVLTYLLRLPPYQHGRYLMPAMPMLFVIGLSGFLEFRNLRVLGRYHLPAQQVWQGSLVLLSLGFFALGARSYGQDVGLIETEMVNTAAWVAHNLGPAEVVAAHDIGALGYFDRHRVIDMAGLVSPEVIPFMRDQARLANYLDQHGADYLIAFPGFYPELEQHSAPVFSTGGRFAAAMGEPNLTVYCWRCK